MSDHISHFKKGEFACHCCGVEKIHHAFLLRLDKARKIAGVPFKITSGYRCQSHNAAVGSRPTSSHVKGRAADLAVIGNRMRFLVLAALIKAGFTRIGIGEGFIHVDSDIEKSQNVTWLY
jgi:uncharacterized protein YcbK (DUF882 family)